MVMERCVRQRENVEASATRIPMSEIRSATDSSARYKDRAFAEERTALSVTRSRRGG